MIYDYDNEILLDFMPEETWRAIEEAARHAERGDVLTAEVCRKVAGYDLLRLEGFGHAEGLVD